jgi:hypothetical protein
MVRRIDLDQAVRVMIAPALRLPLPAALDRRRNRAVFIVRDANGQALTFV